MFYSTIIDLNNRISEKLNSMDLIFGHNTRLSDLTKVDANRIRILRKEVNELAESLIDNLRTLR